MTPVFNYDIQVSLEEAEIQKFLDFTVSALAEKGIEVEKGKEIVLAFVDEERIRGLNKQFRGKDKSTDVLSFESSDPESVGELILCPQVIEENAKKNQWSMLHECCYMVLHGLLHILGYDHEKDDKEAEEMYRLQDDIFFEYFPGEK
jgi:probable rRNA maturation factor